MSNTIKNSSQVKKSASSDEAYPLMMQLASKQNDKKQVHSELDRYFTSKNPTY